MMKGVVDEVDAEIIITDDLFDYDPELFGINEMPEEEISAHSVDVANIIAATLK